MRLTEECDGPGAFEKVTAGNDTGNERDVALMKDAAGPRLLRCDSGSDVDGLTNGIHKTVNV
jgi:hypothetical protein